MNTTTNWRFVEILVPISPTLEIQNSDGNLRISRIPIILNFHQILRTLAQIDGLSEIQNTTRVDHFHATFHPFWSFWRPFPADGASGKCWIFPNVPNFQYFEFPSILRTISQIDRIPEIQHTSRNWLYLCDPPCILEMRCQIPRCCKFKTVMGICECPKFPPF